MRSLLFLVLVGIMSSCIGGSKTGKVSEKPYEPVKRIEPLERSQLDLVEFHAYDDPSAIRLYWVTAREEGASRFTIERSGNGRTWEPIGTVEAKGTTTDRTPYRFSDETPYSGNNFYRLILSYDSGLESGSEVESVLHTGYFNLRLFPNPASLGSQVNLVFDAGEHHEFQVEIVDPYGARVQRESYESDSGTNQLSFVPNVTRAGKYFVHVYLDDYPVQAFTLQLK